ncbi:MAG: RNA polymerase sigma factor [Bacteroidota bacterium]|uniref:RNA polymerase sigma factor n=1 Tax=Candidatus Pollutiaquabacter sp. TaxID=3416354 RepID=UPI001A4688A1|nr:sigma-70 family RNA polymerase sigma factor [Bacteroidota bacterium]MBL7949964.1 sigma-70 family RNA polymerase sigma factor [Bacteroidia bacterium]MBP7268903.1 sigma-70 family RNA polymerase sigma factor [Bacteroidia bacterium]MBP7436293.1 sigma-70 family RNA polymerase sigma factor [Bacteroidia bacterium]MBP7727790.1 sigma-70 family RNA polymerase sigma factor [Bacteroidia bacterium]
MVSRKTIPEQELIELLASRDVKGLEYLYDRYSAALYGVIHRIVGVQERSEEILQETFLRIWERVRHYDPAKGRLFTWMLNIARNLAIDAVRSREFREHRQDDPLEKAEHSHTRNGFNPETIGLRNLVDTLDADYREIIDLLYYRGLTQAEAALKLNIPLGTVKTRSRAALLKLRALFETEIEH